MTEKPDLTDQEILERIAAWTVRRRLTAPAIVFLEAHRPLSFVGSQAMIAAGPIVHFFEPFFQMLTGGYEHSLFERFTRMLEERRETVELLIVEIERKNQEQKARDREEKRRRKALKREARERRRALKRARLEGDS
jgi:hypothetical protein